MILARRPLKSYLSSILNNHTKFIIIIDQIIYSCMTFVVNIISARNLTVEDYGILMLIVTATVLCVGMQRAAFGEPLMILAESFKRQECGRAVNKIVFYCCLLAGIIFSATTIAALYIFSGMVYLALISLTALFLNDAVRFVAISNDRPYLCFLNTVISSFFQLMFLIILSFSGVSNYLYYLYGWAIAAVAGPVVGAIIYWIYLKREKLNKNIDMVEFWRLSSRFTADYALGVVSLQGSLWTATAVSGPVASAALRGADTLLGPFRIFLQSLPSLVLKSWAQSEPALLLGKLLRMIGSVWVLAAIWSLCFILIPPGVGYAVMGQSWSVIHPIMPIVLASLFPVSVSALCLIALKAMMDTKSVLRTRFTVVPIGLFCGVGGAFIYGAEGAAIGALISSVLAACIFLLMVRNSIKNNI